MPPTHTQTHAARLHIKRLLDLLRLVAVARSDWSIGIQAPPTQKKRAKPFHVNGRQLVHCV
ncbi:hypothetical protein T4E_6991 [Trichinella pseudospiralis]|uniref:Uncharacterized protein n=1 Tax=Trichinella pseudospiralis TaxID=6337 RepID=A0A0V1FU55_TRIPS|nr:hypothetical protein T4E_6991 [Trichinella pseudospiralis]KRY88803.1 hypothetical protein T4D_10331 [Trichinella pseudospiralis]